MCLNYCVFRGRSAPFKYLRCLLIAIGVFSFVYWFTLVSLLHTLIKDHAQKEDWQVPYFVGAFLIWMMIISITFCLWYIYRSRLVKTTEKTSEISPVLDKDSEGTKVSEKVKQTLGIEEITSYVKLDEKVGLRDSGKKRNSRIDLFKSETRRSQEFERNLFPKCSKKKKDVADLQLEAARITPLPEYSPEAKNNIFNFTEDAEEAKDGTRSKSPFKDYLHMVPIDSPQSPKSFNEIKDLTVKNLEEEKDGNNKEDEIESKIKEVIHSDEIVHSDIHRKSEEQESKVEEARPRSPYRDFLHIVQIDQEIATNDHPGDTEERKENEPLVISVNGKKDDSAEPIEPTRESSKASNPSPEIPGEYDKNSTESSKTVSEHNTDTSKIPEPQRKYDRDETMLIDGKLKSDVSNTSIDSNLKNIDTVHLDSLEGNREKTEEPEMTIQTNEPVLDTEDKRHDHKEIFKNTTTLNNDEEDENENEVKSGEEEVPATPEEKDREEEKDKEGKVLTELKPIDEDKEMGNENRVKENEEEPDQNIDEKKCDNTNEQAEIGETNQSIPATGGMSDTVMESSDPDENIAAKRKDKDESSDTDFYKTSKSNEEENDQAVIHSSETGEGMTEEASSAHLTHMTPQRNDQNETYESVTRNQKENKESSSDKPTNITNQQEHEQGENEAIKDEILEAGPMKSELVEPLHTDVEEEPSKKVISEEHKKPIEKSEKEPKPKPPLAKKDSILFLGDIGRNQSVVSEIYVEVASDGRILSDSVQPMGMFQVLGDEKNK